MSGDLNNHHRDTLRKIFSHPASGNLEWRQVLSLLEAVGTVSEDHNGKVKVTLSAPRLRSCRVLTVRMSIDRWSLTCDAC